MNKKLLAASAIFLVVAVAGDQFISSRPSGELIVVNQWGKGGSEVSVVQPPDFNRFACTFSHVFGGGYAAGYYSYKWAEVLAADAFSAFEQNGCFDTATAEGFRRSILASGGSRDTMDAFTEFRGRGPSLEPLLLQAGIQPEGTEKS